MLIRFIKMMIVMKTEHVFTHIDKELFRDFVQSQSNNHYNTYICDVLIKVNVYYL